MRRNCAFEENQIHVHRWKKVKAWILAIRRCDCYNYLGVSIENYGRAEKEIRQRITQAERTINQLNGFWWNKKGKYSKEPSTIKSQNMEMSSSR